MTSNLGRPEPILFLELLADALESFRVENGFYPKRFHQLDFSFAAGPYYAGDTGTRPTAEDRDRWRPKDCAYTYVIAAAGASEFRVEAVAPSGEVHYVLTQAEPSPRATPSAPPPPAPPAAYAK